MLKYSLIVSTIKDFFQTGGLEHISCYLFGSYAKAELTLTDKQHSLNEYSLRYIYAVLMERDLDQEILHTLEILQYYRDRIRGDDYFDIAFASFEVHFEIVKNYIMDL